MRTPQYKEDHSSQIPAMLLLANELAYERLTLGVSLEQRLGKVYYQADEKDLPGLIERFRGILPTDARKNKLDVIPQVDLDQFFVPYEL